MEWKNAKLIGSWALKVIASSKVPFIAVQAHSHSWFRKLSFHWISGKQEKINWILCGAAVPFIFYHKSKTSDRKFIKGIHSNLMFTKIPGQ
jgi:hypothetical protein